MEKLTVFFLDGCPYCRNARRAFQELAGGNKAYSGVDIEWVEENQHPEIVKGHEYYYVPTIYAGERKLYEAHPGESYDECKSHVRSALDVAIGLGGQ